MLFAKKRLNYILKYMYEGNDIGIMGINDWERIATETEDKGKNTIKSSHFLSCTYVSPLEAMWHLSYKIHGQFHAAYRLIGY